jgi:hypothetical protein
MSTDQPAVHEIARAVTAGAGGAIVDAWAVPGASRTEIAGLHGGALRIRVAAPPEGGKANRALEKILTTITGADVKLIHGHGSRRKRFFVKDVNPAALARLIAGQIG